MDAVYPAGASALARGRRLRRGPQRARTRTMPVTFAEIKEVDEENEDAGEVCGGSAAEERRRRDELAGGAEGQGAWRGAGAGLRAPDALALEPAALQRQFVESRRRRARHGRDVIPEPPEEASLPRSSSEPRVHAASPADPGP